MNQELGEREREVLGAVVRSYISTGAPVGSAQLLATGEFDVSAATVRNVMSDLEALGFLEKPHTSAGRIPTDRAYRFFVDTMVKLRDPAPRDRELLQSGISVDGRVEETLQEASRLLSFLTQHAGVVLTPRPQATRFHRIEFVKLREDRILAILVDQSGQVHNRAFTVDFPTSSEELVRAANFLSELMRELPMDEVRGRIQREMAEEKAAYDQLSSKALKLGIAATDVPTSDRMLIEGAGSLLEQQEFADVDRMKALLRTLDEKHRLLALFDRVERARQLQIFIGSESEFSLGEDVSVIATPYGNGEQVLGTVGIIGPTRMNYQRVIPLVSFTASIVSKIIG